MAKRQTKELIQTNWWDYTKLPEQLLYEQYKKECFQHISNIFTKEINKRECKTSIFLQSIISNLRIGIKKLIEIYTVDIDKEVLTVLDSKSSNTKNCVKEIAKKLGCSQYLIYNFNHL